MAAGYVPDPAAVAGPGPGAVPPAPAPVPIAAPAPAPAPPSVPTDPVAVAAQNVQATQQLGQDTVANQEEHNQLTGQLNQAKEQFDTGHEARLATFLKQQELHRQAAEAEIAAKRDTYEHQPFHSLYSTRTTGQKVGLALSILASGIGWDSNHQNRALQVIQDAEKQDFEQQKEQHADLWRDLQLSIENKKELSGQQLHDLSDWQLQEAAKWSAVASRLNGMLATNQDKSKTLEARKLAVEATEKANTAYQNAINAKATANHLDAQSTLERAQAKIQPSIAARNAAETNKANAEATESPSKIQKNLAEAQAYGLNGVSTTGAPNPPGTGVPPLGSKVDNAIMSRYVNPVRKEAEKMRSRVIALNGLADAANNPDLTYGEAKQILINTFTAAGGNPQGKIAVADIHEVLPGMQSTFGRFESALNQGSDNKVAPEFRATIQRVASHERDVWSKNYGQSGDSFEQKLGPMSPQARRHYRNQAYPDVGPSRAYPPQVIERAKQALQDPEATAEDKAAAAKILEQ